MTAKRDAFMRKTRAAKKVEGVCYDCPRETDGRHSRCFECRRARAERQWNRKHKEAA